MDRQLSFSLPPVIREIRDMQAVCGAQQPEIENAWAAADTALSDQFVQTAGEYGLSRWERILGITPKGTDPLDARRFRVLGRLNERLPFTLMRFRQMLEALCGMGNASAEIAPGTYRLRIWAAENVWEYLPQLRALAGRVVPVNLVLFYEIRMEPVRVFNQNTFRLANLAIRCRVNAWRQSPVCFNGKADFDGGICWDQQIAASNFLALRIRSGVQATCHAFAGFRFPARVSGKRTGTFSAGARSKARNALAAHTGPARFCCRVKTEQGTAARVITNRGFVFDGGHGFDGRKAFNSGTVTQL